MTKILPKKVGKKQNLPSCLVFEKTLCMAYSAEKKVSKKTRQKKVCPLLKKLLCRVHRAGKKLGRKIFFKQN
jgi:hypothetical protein